jgi:hypothetical protein
MDPRQVEREAVKDAEIDRLRKKIDLLIVENARLWERVKELRRVESYDDKTEPQRGSEEGAANHKEDEGSPRRVRSGIS